MPEYVTVYLDVATEFAEHQKRTEINRLNGEGWLPDEFYGENGVNIVRGCCLSPFCPVQ